MKRLARALVNLSLAKVMRFVVAPWRIGVYLGRPPEAPSGLELVHGLFPELQLDELHRIRFDLITNESFHSTLNSRSVAVRRCRVSSTGWWEMLYLIVRVLRPQHVVETGVFDGMSSAVMLQAMADNELGTLHSIDLPAVHTIAGSTHLMGSTTTLPAGRDPGWIIPDELRSRHELLLGDSRKLLPQLLEALPPIQIFLHDSLHTREHQLFEYRCAWPHLSPGGLLLSDDIFSSRAFHGFCRELRRPYCWHERFGAVRR